MKKKAFINILYKSGVERNYEMVLSNDKEITAEELKDSIKYFQEEMINKAYEKDVGGYLEFCSNEDETVSVNIKSTSEIKFKIM